MSFPDLFQLVPETFRLHSGGLSRFKIECDALTSEQWECLAYMAVQILPTFRFVIGIPRGGLLFAEALKPYAKPDDGHILVADDVCTTGRSFEEYEHPTTIGVVAFARASVPDWVYPVWALSLGIR